MLTCEICQQTNQSVQLCDDERCVCGRASCLYAFYRLDGLTPAVELDQAIFGAWLGTTQN